jgi:hypothetical protein
MENLFITLENEQSPLSFSIQEDNGVPWWICVDYDKRPLYIVSNRCGTCPAVFRLTKERMVPLLEEKVNKLLNEGLSTITNPIVDMISPLLPKGKYLVSLQKISPRYSRINAKEVGYNWENKLDISYKDGFLSESIYPIVPEYILDQDRIRYYYHLPYTLPNLHPTAVTLCFVVDRIPGGRGHYIYVGHILLDGHHKMMAASWRGDVISVLSFWITNSFVSDLTDESAHEFLHSLYPNQ